MTHALATFESRIEGTLAPLTVEFYTQNTQAALHKMEKAGIETLPHKITTEDVMRLVRIMSDEKYAVSTIHDYVSSLKKYTGAWGNYCLDGVLTKLPQDERPKVDWLKKAQAQRLIQYIMSSEATPVQMLTIHLELCMGLRRIEVIRMHVEDIHMEDEYIDIVGKANKRRSVPFAYDTKRVLEKYLEYREGQVAYMTQKYPSTEDKVPEEVLLWTRRGYLYPYAEDGWGLDKVVCVPVEKKLGFRPKNHTLRRTFGRSLWISGIPVETISKILGHKSTEQTLGYIGVNMDDMRKAMKVNPYE